MNPHDGDLRCHTLPLLAKGYRGLAYDSACTLLLAPFHDAEILDVPGGDFDRVRCIGQRSEEQVDRSENRREDSWHLAIPFLSEHQTLENERACALAETIMDWRGPDHKAFLLAKIMRAPVMCQAATRAEWFLVCIRDLYEGAGTHGRNWLPW